MEDIVLTLTVRDEYGVGAVGSTSTLTFEDEAVNLREIIRRRVNEEVQRRAMTPKSSQSWLQPTEFERVLNGYGVKAHRAADGEARYQQALDSFARGDFLILVGDEQVCDLDVRVTSADEVTFLKLVPLVGG